MNKVCIKGTHGIINFVVGAYRDMDLSHTTLLRVVLVVTDQIISLVHFLKDIRT